ncbi:uncharacterized protein PG986_008670 [Apiospora aurea]|uniref:Major facilitator superfamily (MFS) profile domain-containing protein n=1 Tax=Apiospora aurea TaxID=335848 RepID=A0ABR1Q5I6_9PEZI
MESANSSPTPEREPYPILTSRHRKVLTVLLGLASVTSPLTANIYLPLLPLLQEQYHASAQAINLTITLYVVVQAIMPIFFAPTADQYGRRLVSLANLMVYTVGSIGLVVNDLAGRKYAALLLLRALQAFGSSACATTIWGVVSDVCIPAERGAMVGPVISISNVGTVIGPVVGGLVAWRTGDATWVFASMAIFSAVTLVSITVLLPETARSVVGNGGQGERLTRKGARGWLTLGPQWANKHTEAGTLSSEGPSNVNTDSLPSSERYGPHPVARQLHLRRVVHDQRRLAPDLQAELRLERALDRPLVPPVRRDHHPRRFRRRALVRARYRRTAREAGLPADGHGVDGFPVEKARIREMWIVHAVTHLSIAGLGWAVQYRAHPAVILVLQGVAGFVKSLLFSSFNTLLIDVHPDRPSTAAAAASLTRSGLSGIGLAILQPLADSLGWAWFFTLLALVVGVTQGVWHACVAEMGAGMAGGEDACEAAYITGHFQMVTKTC